MISFKSEVTLLFVLWNFFAASANSSGLAGALYRSFPASLVSPNRSALAASHTAEKDRFSEIFVRKENQNISSFLKMASTRHHSAFVPPSFANNVKPTNHQLKQPIPMPQPNFRPIVSKTPKNQSTSSALFAKIRFVGTATATLNGKSSPSPVDSESSSTKSLTDFLTSSASNPVLLGMKSDSSRSNFQKIDNAGNPRRVGNEEVEVWECQQSSVEWFGMTLVPIFVNEIERRKSNANNDGKESVVGASTGTVVVSIIDSKTRVEGGRLGNTLASAMKRSKFEGKNVVDWKERSVRTVGKDGDEIVHRYTLEGNIKIVLTINLPPFLPLPPGFNSIGSKIVERTCRDRLRENLRSVSDAYLSWVESSVMAQ